jgi:hypothetical protein
MASEPYKENLMSPIKIYLSGVSAIAMSLVALTGCDGQVTIPAVEKIDIPRPNIDTAEYTDNIEDLYERAKAAGEQVPEDALTWAKSDVKKIGTWDYKIETFSTSSHGEDEILAKLQELGGLRWECFWVEELNGTKSFYFKKAQRSYIQTFGKAAPLIPVPGKGE